MALDLRAGIEGARTTAYVRRFGYREPDILKKCRLETLRTRADASIILFPCRISECDHTALKAKAFRPSVSNVCNGLDADKLLATHCAFAVRCWPRYRRLAIDRSRRRGTPAQRVQEAT